MNPRTVLASIDDDFHESGSDPSWTETAWYSMEDPERRLSLTVYPLFRPNLSIASLAISRDTIVPLEILKKLLHRFASASDEADTFGALSV